VQVFLLLRAPSRYLLVTVVSRAQGDAVATGWGSTPISDTSEALGRALVAAPGVAVALLDWCARRQQIASWSRVTQAEYAGTLLLSVILWGALAAAASARRAWASRTLLVVSAALAVGAQRYFFVRYHAYMNPRSVLVGTSMLPSVGQQLWVDRVSFLAALAPPVVLALLWPALIDRVAPLAPRRSRIALDVATAALLVAVFAVDAPGRGEQAGAPDVLYLASMGRLATDRWQADDPDDQVHPGPRHPISVPGIATRGPRRSVLFVVTESVRGTDACSVPTPDCATTPFTNALLPQRYGLSQMRALDSTTAVSVAVLWSGLPPTASRRALHEAPLLWEYAHAAGFDTAYWTAQNLKFANSGTWLEGLPLSHQISGTDLDPNATYEIGADDGKLVDVVLRELPSMVAAPSPFVGVVHLSNTHFPYLIDAADAPFQPQSTVRGAGDAESVHNRYRDAIHRQDAIVARLVRGVRAFPGGDRVGVVFISDHGEQIRERGAVGHTWGVYDEEVRVPFWIDVPDGSLAPKQVARLRALERTPVTELDVLPTILDLMGIWDAPELSLLRRPMPGESLLRKSGSSAPVVLTNCSSIFTCAFKNWGAMQLTKKLVATENDTQWKCFDVATDPLEEHDLGAAACGTLRALAEGDGRGAPF
jgi:glucan phosphoethanolaminetransferase (alkaline phosphatase superfamily)